MKSVRAKRKNPTHAYAAHWAKQNEMTHHEHKCVTRLVTHHIKTHCPHLIKRTYTCTHLYTDR